MIFIITISDPNENIIFKDLFLMDSELEVNTKFQFLEETEQPDETLPEFHLEIKTIREKLIKASTSSITTIQNYKEKIYDLIIEKLKENQQQNTH
mgnify:FL=1|tara:strand:- start:10512 stop:10796 length:285 start_codon:yes stop_codon:yes gene_type:complete